MKSKSVDMISGPLFKGLFVLTVPIMVMNVAQTLFNLLDMAVLRVFGFEQAVGAVGACSMLITLCTSLLIGISVGSNVIVARRIGSGDRERVNKAVSTSVLFSVLGGILLMFAVSLYQEKKGSVRDLLWDKPVLRYTLIAALLVVVLLMGSYGIGYNASSFIYNQF